MKFLKNDDRGAMLITFESIVFMVVYYLYYPFIQMFGKRMGAGDGYVALLNAAPSFVAVFVLIPFSVLIDRINRKKKTIMVLIFFNSLFYAAIALIPFIPHQAKVLAYVVLIGLMNCPGSLYLAVWKSFFADNFTGLYGNSVYTRGKRYSTFFGLITVTVTGLMITVIPKSDEERLFLYQVFYVLCFLLTLVQMYLFSRIPEQERQEKIDEEPTRPYATKKLAIIPDKEEIAGIISNKPFITFCLCGLAFHIAWQYGFTLTFIYNADYARLNEFQFSLMSVALGLSQSLSYSFWNKLIERKGNYFTLVASAVLVALNPFAMITLWNFPVLILVNIFMGVTSSGYNLSLFTTLLEMLPAEKKTIYISVFSTITSFTGFLAPIIGVWVYSSTNIYIAIGIGGVFRVAAAIFYAVSLKRLKT